ncbi:MAG TPA: nuclease-related domain-containing protein [Anaerolineae bacterium]|nr:nuclease-related domain-containing protein [Anaerolineae bacterium]
MRVIQNDNYIKSRSRIGRYAFFGGFGILLLGLLISLTSGNGPQAVALFPVSLACLAIGLILSQVGGYYVRRFDRGDLPHLTLTKALKGFDDRYTLVHYGAPAAHVLLAPDAVYTLIPKSQAGRISYENGRWRNPTGLRRVLTWMSEEGLGNPTREAAAEVARLQRHLARHLPDTPVEVQPLIVFTHPNVNVDFAALPIPAIHVKKAKDWLRARPKGNLTREARAALEQLFK